MSLFAMLTLISACDQLPPRTPVKAARVLSGLSIPYFSKTELFDDQSMGGDASTVIRIKPDSAAFDALLREAKTKGYRLLPAPAGLDRVGLGGYSAPASSGLYFFEEYPRGRGFKTVVLDAQRRTVNVQAVIY
jgi:hypothetical protein